MTPRERERFAQALAERKQRVALGLVRDPGFWAATKRNGGPVHFWERMDRTHTLSGQPVFGTPCRGLRYSGWVRQNIGKEHADPLASKRVCKECRLILTLAEGA